VRRNEKRGTDQGLENALPQARFTSFQKRRTRTEMERERARQNVLTRGKGGSPRRQPEKKEHKETTAASRIARWRERQKATVSGLSSSFRMGGWGQNGKGRNSLDWKCVPRRKTAPCASRRCGASQQGTEESIR